jgi:hypothetical protein
MREKQPRLEINENLHRDFHYASITRLLEGPGASSRAIIQNHGIRPLAWCPRFAFVFWTLTWVRGRRHTFSRELQHGNQLLQSDLEDFGNFQKRMAVGDALQDLSQRRVRSTDPDTRLPQKGPGGPL